MNAISFQSLRGWGIAVGLRDGIESNLGEVAQSSTAAPG